MKKFKLFLENHKENLVFLILVVGIVLGVKAGVVLGVAGVVVLAMVLAVGVELAVSGGTGKVLKGELVVVLAIVLVLGVGVGGVLGVELEFILGGILILVLGVGLGEGIEIVKAVIKKIRRVRFVEILNRINKFFRILWKLKTLKKEKLISIKSKQVWSSVIYTVARFIPEEDREEIYGDIIEYQELLIRHGHPKKKVRIFAFVQIFHAAILFRFKKLFTLNTAKSNKEIEK